MVLHWELPLVKNLDSRNVSYLAQEMVQYWEIQRVVCLEVNSDDVKARNLENQTALHLVEMMACHLDLWRAQKLAI